MNLARLAAYATDRRLVYGWRRRYVPWVLDITDPHDPRFTPHGSHEDVPYVRRSGKGSAPRPGCDTLDYLIGRHHDAWTDQLRRFAEHDDGPGARAARTALDAGILTSLVPPPSSKPSDLVVLRASGQLIHQDPGLARFWEAQLRTGLDAGLHGVCLCCAGTAAPLARLVPAYLPPSAFRQNGAGDLALYPASKNRPGTSPVPVCLDCACALGAALPDLAGRPDHHHRTQEGTLLLWWGLDGAGDFPLGALLTHPDPAALAAAPTSGRLCAMLLKPATGRIALTWFLDEPTRTVLDRIRHWYDTTGVYDGWSDTIRLTGIPSMHHQLGRWNPRTRTYQHLSPTTPPESGLWTAALSGHLPHQHARAALTATRRDNRVSTGRTALLQLCSASAHGAR
ncbi:type I-C CRISPR-associated protein Cas8c/Csd1 [Streptomyces botrytidirepellens]|uniref:Uncharacterized protein n=1 Tax=Streptomyces botrytidirepellens TaxID=2486417 RepID=A0A3M8SZD7_9ACTN|nr:type I-C CRISPR-associated protein Cas8c/Csd1 [Streptomyces botrytidirepellens]RNF86761.1 hypothetical protein EEJ42_42910 [Streptomyces botrytidirepellens]